MPKRGMQPIKGQLSLFPMRPERRRDHYDDDQQRKRPEEKPCATGQATHYSDEAPIAGDNSQTTQPN